MLYCQMSHRALSKSAHKNNLMNLNNGVNHIHLFKNHKINHNSALTSSAIAEVYDLDFESKSFGSIRMKHISGKADPLYIQKFFNKLEDVESVTITVPDPDAEPPVITEHSRISLGETTWKLSAYLFWALMSEETKSPYVHQTDSHYERLENLLFDRKKEVYVEEQ